MMEQGEATAAGGSGDTPGMGCAVQNTKIMAPEGTLSSVTVSLHPLVIMNISEHWTRIKAENDGTAVQVIGALIGQVKGRAVEIMNSFELVGPSFDGLLLIDMEYYRMKDNQFKQVFPNMEFLGWYTTGELNATSEDISIQKQVSQINENSVFLKLNPTSRNMDELPIFIFESIIDVVDGKPNTFFAPLTYTLATEDSERIGLEHVARNVSVATSINGNDGSSVAADHLTDQFSSIKILFSRVRTILNYIKAVEKGEAPMCHDVFREAKALITRLPVIDPERFKHEYEKQCSDVAMITYLSMITKGCDMTYEFIKNFSLLNLRSEPRRRDGDRSPNSCVKWFKSREIEDDDEGNNNNPAKRVRITENSLRNAIEEANAGLTDSKNMRKPKKK